MRTFIDSNVFIYSFLNQGVEKKQVAARLLVQAIRDGNGYISLQVVKEFCNVLAKKSNKPIKNAPSRAVMPQTDTGVKKTGVAGIEIAKKGMTDL